MVVTNQTPVCCFPGSIQDPFACRTSNCDYGGANSVSRSVRISFRNRSETFRFINSQYYIDETKNETKLA